MFSLLNATQVYGIQQQQHQQLQLQPPLQLELQAQQGELDEKSLLAIATKKTKTRKQSLQQRYERQSNLSSSSLSSAAPIDTCQTSSTDLTYRKLLTKKSTSNLTEKFLKSELLNGCDTGPYDTLKHYKNFRKYYNTNNNSHYNNNNNNNLIQLKRHSDPIQEERLLSTFDCLHGSYRHNFDNNIYKNITTTARTKTILKENVLGNEMTIKYSRHLLGVEPNEIAAAATLQHYQKIPENINDLINVGHVSGDNIGNNGTIIGIDNNSVIQSSGASSGEFNCSSDATTISNNASSGNSSTSTNTNSNANTIASTNSSTNASTNLYKQLSFGGRRLNNVQKSMENSHNSSVDMAIQMPASVSHFTKNNAPLKCMDLQRRSSSTSSGDYHSNYERSKKNTSNVEKTNSTHLENSDQVSSEKMQRRKLIQMISNYEQQNIQLQRELAKERRRRTEELACVVKSLLCFESKLKKDMKSINQRLLQKDMEICHLLRQNHALRKHFNNMRMTERNTQNEGVVEGETESIRHSSKDQSEIVPLEIQGENDCRVMAALQCINCHKQFYDIEMINNSTQTLAGSCNMDSGNRNNVEPTSEHNSSSDETVSSSFFDARRSVRYTSKRTSGTFRDYMRSRAMNVDDPSQEVADFNSEECGDGDNSCISRNESTNSYDKLHIYSRTIERLHGVKSESERDSEQSGLETTTSISTRSTSRASTKSSKSCSSYSIGKNSKSNHSLEEEEDDGIFSHAQDDDFDEGEQHHPKRQSELKQINEETHETSLKRRSRELFSEVSPKQIYETSTDDWYASASDQDETSTTGILSANCYGHGAINPVLECVNQILLQQSMEVVEEQMPLPTTAKSTTTLPRRSSLSDRRNGHYNIHSNGTFQNSTLTRKRVHFSTKNSMVHVPRDDDENDECGHHNHNPNCNSSIDDDKDEIISNYQIMSSDYIRHSSHFLKEDDDDNDDDNDNGKSTAANNIGSSMKSLCQNNGIDKKFNEKHHVDSICNVAERLDLLNYESIYSNEYEPIGSEINSSNLYVDMETTILNGKINDTSNVECYNNGRREDLCKTNQKLPPALPPKPANLMKFRKKSLGQLIEYPEEREENWHEVTTITTATIIEPDYCSISEVNENTGDDRICNGNGDSVVGGGEITSVQIKADIHRPPVLQANNDYLESITADKIDIESVTVVSDNASQKTEEIEEIFADIPKLPNVAAIIAPKSGTHNLKNNNSNANNNNNINSNDYILMNPKLNHNNHGKSNEISLESFKVPSSTTDRKDLRLDLNLLMNNSSVSKDGHGGITNLTAVLPTSTTHTSIPLKHTWHICKYDTNIWNKINKRFSLPNSPMTSTSATIVTDTMPQGSPFVRYSSTDLPMQAEFDWYNLDAEYGCSTIDTTADVLLGNDGLSSVLINSSLSEIQEDGESVITVADEYDLDEQYGNDENHIDDTYEKQQQRRQQLQQQQKERSEQQIKMVAIKKETSTINRNFQENTRDVINTTTNTTMTSTRMQILPALPFTTSTVLRAKKIKNNLENFEKFIETSGLSAKPLVTTCNATNTTIATTTKRKIYFSGPFV